MRRKLPHDNINKKKRNVSEYRSRHSQLYDKGLNNLDIYLKDYKRRYGEKKGLSKLYCYCEKKVFDKIQHIDELVHRYQNQKRRLKKIVFKKYGIFLVLIALIPALALIYPILFGTEHWGKGIIKDCDEVGHMGVNGGHITSKSDCHKYSYYENGYIIKNVAIVHKCVSFIIIAFFLLFLIYSIIKFIKYERLKYGKVKTCAK
ncbi:hypothetical protein PVNG_05843 [Plasmodium vivax North Korean]|uniref:Variable surface protein n=1 Tax=Plasmodium vivax North Korean TaxID=1035514 RepID=A0A0J9TL81_PLAVI|nr:hypothetical protein PVNG_05843 [Plasmodium vivax North Korean]